MTFVAVYISVFPDTGQADRSIYTKVRPLCTGSTILEIESRDPGQAQLAVVIMVPTQEGYVLYVCTNFQADDFIKTFIKRYKGVQNFEIGSRDPGHAHLGVNL